MPETPVADRLGGSPEAGEKQQQRRVAVIFNPIKVSDDFRALIEDCAAKGHWADTLWLETSIEDPGRGMVRRAVAEPVDLVVCAGETGRYASSPMDWREAASRWASFPRERGTCWPGTSVSHWRRRRRSKSRSTGTRARSTSSPWWSTAATSSTLRSWPGSASTR